MEDLDKNIQDTEREFKRFYQQAVALKEIIGELTPQKRALLDIDMWEFKIKEMAAIDWISTSRLGNNTIEMLMAFPSDRRIGLLSEIKDQSTLIGWYEKHEGTELTLIDVDIKKLLE